MPRLRRCRRVLLILPMILGLAPRLAADEASSARLELLKLVPPQSSMILTVDDLSGRARELLSSRMFSDFQTLPAVKAWFETRNYRDFEAARAQIENVFQVSIAEIRDRLFGNAIVVALDLPPDLDEHPNRARGLLLLKASDPALLEKLIDRLNTIQKANGDVSEIVERTHLGRIYHVRKMASGPTGRTETYVTFADGTFGISNAEESIHRVIERRLGKTAQPEKSQAIPSAAARFLSLQERLPERALARVSVDPQFFSQRIEESPKPLTPGLAWLKRHVTTLEAVGAALVVRDGQISLEIAEVFAHAPMPDRSEGGKSHILSEQKSTLGEISNAALAGGELRLDPPQLYQLLRQFIPEQDQFRLADIETALNGLLLGQDFRARILPSLGPRVLAFADDIDNRDPNPAPGEATATQGTLPFNAVFVLELKGTPGAQSNATALGTPEISVAAAVENALTTFLALASLDEQGEKLRSRLVTQTTNGLTIRSLEPPRMFAFSVDHTRHRLIVGTTPDAIKRLIGPAESLPEAGIRRLRASAFASAESFLGLNLAAIRGYFQRHRQAIVDLIASRDGRPREEVARDLEAAAALAAVFEIAAWTHRNDPSAKTAFHTVTLLSRQATTASTPTSP